MLKSKSIKSTLPRKYKFCSCEDVFILAYAELVEMFILLYMLELLDRGIAE